ncbi:MAG: flagellar protein FlaG [Lachnospiraceae bacterium]|nr:flagellar protein FlaG [Lachnospiraceae bacterium]
MAMEPLGSLMSVQMQNIAPVETVKPVVPEGTDAAAQEVGAQLDATTAGVSSVRQKGDEADSAGQQAQQQGQNAQNAQQPSKEQMKDAVSQMNKKMENSEAIFGIHEGTNRVTIKIVDKDTKKVIKELPPEKTLDMIAKVWEMAGLLVDEKR